MNPRIDFDLLNELLEKRDFMELRSVLTETNEVDVAEFLEELDNDKAIVVFRMLPKDFAAEVFAELESDTQMKIVESITDRELSYIIEELFVDDAVDLLEELPAILVKRVLKSASVSTRNVINQFLKYPKNSAGSIMTAEFTDLRASMTVGEAIEHIRQTGENRETIYTCFVIDKQRFLKGVVSVKDLLLAEDNMPLSEVMDDDIIMVKTTDDQEDVAQLFSRYNLLSLPVVDNENRLVGIVTVDDAVDVITEEATEDFEKMAAMRPSDQPYLKTSVFDLAKHRILWLLVLMVSSMVTGAILENYTAAFAAIPLLVTFIPMLTDTGGNAGSQSSTLIIRGMALGEIETRDIWKVIWKEMRVSITVGIALAAVNFVRLIIMYPGQYGLALTVALALFATVFIAKTIGGTLPMLAKFLKADPALMAAPLITTIVDALALIIYFSIARQLLGV